MKRTSVFGAFNARWISSEEVARTFVPIPQYNKLMQTRHSILMGPRGCGKTTLLKMLTRDAQNCWWSERIPLEPQLEEGTQRPDFEAIYIPSDIRWLYELKSIPESLQTDNAISERTQRTMVSLAIQYELTKVFEQLLHNDVSLIEKLTISLINHWGAGGFVPKMGELRIWLTTSAASIRSRIARRDANSVLEIIDLLPESFSSHALDSVELSCAIFNEIVPAKYLPQRWALCFDELEIAPCWLQDELLRSLRSTIQSLLLKLTWSPVLPQVLTQEQQQQADYDAIRIWHSHIRDAKSFCLEFSKRLIRDRLGVPSLTPREVFGKSLFAAEERLGEGEDVYTQGSDIWNTMVRLGDRDKSFVRFLTRKGFDHNNPTSDSTKSKDECLRKIKPIVLLRETFRGTDRARSRKRPALYAGEDAIYSMSDGNPRWLAGILNELLDNLPFNGLNLNGSEEPLIKPSQQAPVLAAASKRMMSYIRAYPTGEIKGRKIHLEELIKRLGQYVSTQILKKEFTDDPAGSFLVDDNLTPNIIYEIDRGLLLGAFFYVGDSPFDVPRAITGSRLRLSFMFSPAFKLAFRNLRPVTLSSALKSSQDPEQKDLFETGD